MTEMKTWHIDGFGHFHNRQIEFRPGMNLIFGRNESGKSTLHAYMRYVLFGPDSARSANKYEPLDGGKHGGRLVLSADGEDLIVERYGKTLKIDGSEVEAESKLRQALGRSDRSLFESVYGFDYEQMVEGSTLQGDQINARIFSASVRGGGAAASAVRAEFTAAADRLLANRKTTPRINSLIIEHEQVSKLLKSAHLEVEENAELYGEREHLTDSSTSVLADLDLERKRLSTLDTKISAQDMRTELVELRASLAEMPQPIRELVGFDIESRLEMPLTNASKLHHRAQLGLEAIQAKAEHIKLNSLLWECRDDINGLQLDVEQMRKREVNLQDSTRQLKNLCEEQKDAIGGLPNGLNVDSVRVNATHIERVRYEHQRWMSQIQTSQTSKDVVDSLSQKLGRMPVTERPTAPSNTPDLKQTEDLLVAREELTTLDTEAQVAQAKRGAPNAPHVSIADIYKSFIILMIGAVLLAIGIGIWVSGSILPGVIASILGVLAIGFAIVSLRKSFTNPSVEPQKDDVETERPQTVYRAALKAFNMAASKLGLSNASMAEIRGRLSALQSERAEHQRMATAYDHAMKTKDDLERDLDEAKRHLQRANEEVESAQNAWKKLVIDAGLNAELAPEIVPSVLETCVRAQTLERKISQTQRDIDAWRAEVDTFENRANEALGSLLQPNQSSAAQVKALEARLMNETALRDQHQTLLEEMDAAELEVNTEAHARRDVEKERDEVLAVAGVSNLLELRQKVMSTNAFVKNEEEAADLQRRLTSVLGYNLDEGEPSDWSNLPDEKDSCESKIEEIEGNLDVIRNRLAEVETRLRGVATNTQLQELEQRIEGIRRDLEIAVTRWCVLVRAEKLVGESLRVFTDTHQPSVLKTASELIGQATEGKYSEIRLADDGETILLVATHDKAMKEPKLLSKGTREALYFCIRLAFAMELAQRTCPLPFAMDDVLLTTDDLRRGNLIRVLIEVAHKHQVIYFTCHEEIRDLFAENHETTLIELEPAALPAAA